ncbi:hypothetical protein NA57DRAFT_73449 [Rhizodiscina lignyota]|uniref:Uncharacterized protein n=1 Tax=Rhizodiscina lignyota TaxID=1504668 RepID=A0A9P4M9E2_9PEZI|nr:hypothetical protein NA57DRAFT_73449 [Rhizodiscina lignyota]
MSSSIAIPKRRKRLLMAFDDAATPESSASSSSSFSSPAESSAAAAAASSSSPSQSSSSKESGWSSSHLRRPSLLSSSIRQSEHTVINIGNADAPRLITCVRSSQGFDWNQDIFLPSYANDYGSATDLEHKPDPIEDIVLTDEEAASLLPS